MQREFKSLSWKVKNFDVNRQVIEDYDVLKYYQDFIKKLKKKCATKEEFSKKIHLEMMCQYWSRCEYELIIEITDGERILLKPWAGCRDEKKATIDVTEDTSFDWMGFAKENIKKQIYKNEAKIDVYSQLEYVWDEFVDYCWYTRLKYERKDSKFDK